MNFDWATKDLIVYECCPVCGDETQVTCDGKTNCPKCGRKNVLPCSECMHYNDPMDCDWEETGCAFTRHVGLDYHNPN